MLLLEEFLIARVAANSEAQAAEIALSQPGIDRQGERIGTQGVLIEQVGGKSNPGGGGAGVGGKKKGFLQFYGWGKDSTEENVGSTSASGRGSEDVLLASARRN